MCFRTVCLGNRNISLFTLILAGVFAAVFGLAGPVIVAGSVQVPAATTAPATEPASTPASRSVNIPIPSPSPSLQATTRPGRKYSAVSSKALSRKPFVGAVNATDVNVRSGPGMAYYPVGQLTRGDLVRVVGTVRSWYRIAAPVGTRCYIAGQYVKLAPAGASGRVTADFVNLRAASAMAPASHYAVVGLVRRGTHVSITGQSGKFLIIRPPHGTTFYIAARFIRPAAAGSVYVTARIKMPAGFHGPGLATRLASSAGTGGASAVTTQPAATTQAVVPLPSRGVSTSSGVPAPTSRPAVIPVIPGLVAPAPQVSYNQPAYTAFSRLNHKIQLEFRKPLLQERHLASLLKGYQNLLKRPQLPPSVRRGSIARIKLLKKELAIQKLVESAAKTPPIKQVIAPYQQQWKKSQEEIAKAYENAPYLAKGVLKTSQAIKDYALVDPATGRVIAYLVPAGKIAISKLLGSYIGVKGEVISKTGMTVKVIQVVSATLLPPPHIRRAPGGGGSRSAP